MRNVLAVCALALTVGSTPALSADKAPWWKQRRIVFMWGQWDLSRQDKSRPHKWEEELPLEVFRNVALAGGTVFVASRGWQPGNARLAHEFGMKYFANRMANALPGIPGRNWVQENGDEFPHPGYPKGMYYFRCPVDESVYEKWLIEPFLEGIRQGLIDGVHTDWEHYSGGGEAKGVCYCDGCFSEFLAIRKLNSALPERSKRFALLKDQGLVDDYKKAFHQRRVEMFTRIRKKLQAVKPDLLFSTYNLNLGDFTRAMNTPKTPLIYCDQRFYYNDERKAWWESYSNRLKQEGYMYIPGGWTNALFGGQPSEVSAAKWIYEAAINEDGVWLWFERELDDEILRAYSTADSRIKAVEGRVGEFLLQGKRDLNFLTAVEWTGRPELEKAVVHRSYHLGSEHLAHVSNVDTQWPLRVRLRFPRLSVGRKWTVQDAMCEFYYTCDGKSAVWTTAQLEAGLVVSMEPRTDLFLRISPANESIKPEAIRLVPSRELSALPSHADAFAHASLTKAASAIEPGGGLVYTATEPMGFEGSEGPFTIGNGISIIGPDGESRSRLRQLRGHLWSPKWSPDGRRIMFVHDAGGRGQICVMNSDGSNAVNLSDAVVSGTLFPKLPFCDRHPAWSPDGSKIAFVSDRSGDWDIWVMNADGSGQRRLAGNVGVDRAPSWSPNGKRIAWESHVSGMPNVWTCTADGAYPAPLIRKDRQLRLWQVYTGDADPDFPDNTLWLMDPVWSPDGQHIAAVELGHMSADQIAVVISADGSTMVRHVPNPIAGDLCWSPDGKALAAWSKTQPAATERSGIYVAQVDGVYNTRWLIEAKPQGPRLGGLPPVYDWKPGRPSPGELATWYSHGGALPTRVLKTFCSLAWSPDGKTLAFSSDMDSSGAFHVYTISSDGGQPTRLDATKSAWPNEIMWRPR